MKAILRKMLPSAQVLKLKKAVASVDNKIFPFFAKNSFLSSVYYCFFSTQFRREHKAVLQGRVKYARSLSEIKTSSVLLRRNTHRLEKGLIMQPRRPVFAEDYISETVSCYSKSINSDELCENELKWACDVLTRYFDVTGSSIILDKARQQFEAIVHKEHHSEDEFLPYQHKNRTTSDISVDQLYNLFRQRRSVRWYQQKPVEVSLVKQAVELASQAPSACNRQPFQFQLIMDMNKASEIAALAMGTTGFSDNIPALIAVVGDLSAYPAERDRHGIYIDGSLASMQLMLAFETLGLSSCPINWPDVEILEKKIAKKLKLSYQLRPVMLIAVGYADPDGHIPYSQKKSSNLLSKEVH